MPDVAVISDTSTLEVNIKNEGGTAVGELWIKFDKGGDNWLDHVSWSGGDNCGLVVFEIECGPLAAGQSRIYRLRGKAKDPGKWTLTPQLADLSVNSSPDSPEIGRLAPATVNFVNCKPSPCLSHGGQQVLLDQVDRNATVDLQAEAGTHWVRIVVDFVNDAPAPDAGSFITGDKHEENASSSDFELKDPDGVTRRALLGGVACGDWQTATLAPGGRLRGKPICFASGGTPSGRLELHWQGQTLSLP